MYIYIFIYTVYKQLVQIYKKIFKIYISYVYITVKMLEYNFEFNIIQSITEGIFVQIQNYHLGILMLTPIVHSLLLLSPRNYYLIFVFVNYRFSQG